MSPAPAAVATLGRPCWDAGRVAQVITNIAKMDAARSHYFLATHSPISGIFDERRRVDLDEEGLFAAVFDTSRGETLAVISGDPGTGKSHLVHWLKLRSDYALEQGELKDVLPVLIQRRTGALKDALTQLVEQLPKEFSTYLKPVQQALGKIADETAREMLAQQIYLELGPERRKERGLPPLEGHLAGIREFCASQGFRTWLQRPGGVIDINMKRLSSAEVDASSAEFTAREFTGAPPQFCNPEKNLPQVCALLDEFTFEADGAFASTVARSFNDALPYAVRELSGLSGMTLPDIFERIRKDLKTAGKTLALFVEDVSVMSALELDILRAVEPRSRLDLCRLVAVLGMTAKGRGALRDNELDRITHLVHLRQSVEGWRESPARVASFAARYMNALRLDERRVRDIAQRRRAGGDVSDSACTDCKVRQGCFETFGFVDIGDQELGLFPLNAQAPHRLLHGLDGVSVSGTLVPRRHQRGFLDDVLRPLLAKTDLFEENRFPQKRELSSVTLRDPMYWSAFVEAYCGGWSQEDRERLKFVAQGWGEATTLDGYASELTPFLLPFGFPLFSKASKVAAQQKKKVTEVAPAVVPIQQTQPEPEFPKRLRDLQGSLSAWVADDKQELHPDTWPRELVRDLLANSLPREDSRGLPPSEFTRLLNDKSAIYIEGQRSRPANVSFQVKLPRDKQTGDLLEALGYFAALGSNSWKFDHAEHYKRVVSRWLRKHGRRILEGFQPEGLDRNLPIAVGTRLLCLAATVRRHGALPGSAAEMVSEIFQRLEAPSKTLAPDGKWSSALALLSRDHEALREFVISEIAVFQGRAKKIQDVNFVNPCVVLEAAEAFAKEFSVQNVPKTYFERYWGPRYVQLEIADEFESLKTLLADERKALAQAVAEMRAVVSWGGSTESLGKSLETFVARLKELAAFLKKERRVYPDPIYDACKQKFNAIASWVTALEGAEDLLQQEGLEKLAWLEPQRLLEVRDALRAAGHYLATIDKALAVEEKQVAAGGDAPALATSLQATLAAIVAGESGKGED